LTEQSVDLFVDSGLFLRQSAYVADVIESTTSEPIVPSSTVLRRRRVLVVSVVLLAIGAAVVWWSYGGTRLTAAGARYGVPVPEGQDASFGIIAQTDDGGRVRLDSVSANVSAGATITWSVYQAAPGALGFGAWHGPLLPRWPTVPVAGYDRVSTGDTNVKGGTWIVGTVDATSPGVYRVTDVSVHYHSGWRGLSASTRTTACVLVYPAGSSVTAFLASADPLVAEYNDCVEP
jgi:hypothetical protein